jgi:DNA polymerase IV
VRKSIGAEDTFLSDITDLGVAMEELQALVAKVWSQCEEKGFSGKTVTVKVKYADFTQVTRSRTSSMALAGGDDMLKATRILLASVYPFKRPVRLLGVTLSSLTSDKGCDDEARAQLGLGLDV